MNQTLRIVPDGFEHNCMTLDGPQASTVDVPFAASPTFDCFGHCDYGNPPPFGDCPEVDPYECNGQTPPGGEDEVGTEDGGTDTTDGGVFADLPRAP